MNIFNKLDLNTKINIYIIGLLIVILSFLGVYIFTDQKKIMIKDIDKQVEVYLNDIDYYFQQLTNQNKENTNLITDYFLNDLKVIKQYDSISTTIEREETISEIRNKLKNNLNLVMVINNYFTENIRLNSDFQHSIIFKNGDMVLTNAEKAIDISQSKIFNKIKFFNDNKVHKESYLWPENKEGKNQIIYVKYIPLFNAFICLSAPEKVIMKDIYKLRNILIIGIFLSVIVLSFTLSLIIKSIIKEISNLSDVVKKMSKGIIENEISTKRQDELGEIIHSLNLLIQGLKRTTIFSKQIGEGNLDARFTPLSDYDDLGNSLLEMRESLNKADNERKIQAQKENERNWATAGHAKFADILRNNNNDIKELSFQIISELVKYLNVNQGGIFIINNDQNDKSILEMTGCFAYDRMKHIKKTVEIGEGLVGTCFVEKERIYITDVPEGYMDIVSGLGDSSPKSILIVPLKVNEEVQGIVELASFHEFEKYKIEFVEKVGEIIASTLSNVKSNMRTSSLLQQFQHQSEEMKSQEEELRQNMEELQATQEEATRREAELRNTIYALNNSVGTLELDMSGYILDANIKYLQMAEISLPTIQGKHIRDFMDHKIAESTDFSNIWRELTSGHSHSGGHQYFFNNKEKWFFETFSPVKDDHGNYYKIISISYDISYTRLKESELKKINEEYSNLIEQQKKDQ